MNCICGNPAKWEANGVWLCDACHEKGFDHIICHCLTCGAYGFIRKNPENLMRLQAMLGMDEMACALYTSISTVIIDFKVCMACAEMPCAQRAT